MTPALKLLYQTTLSGHSAYSVNDWVRLCGNARTPSPDVDSYVRSGDVYVVDGTVITPASGIGDARCARWLASRSHERAGAPLPLTTPPAEAGGAQWGAGQAIVVAQLAAGGGGVLRGLPGTGKTWVLAKIIEQLVEKGKRVMVAAPTNKAASVLAMKVDVPVTSLHRLLGWYPGQVPDYNAKNPLDADVVIIDESSMMDSQMMGFLMDALDDSTNLILCGDERQLDPVGHGAPFRDIIKHHLLPVCTLKDVVRQKAGSSLVQMVHAAARGALDIPVGEEIIVVPGRGSAKDHEDLAVRVYLDHMVESEPRDTMLLSPYRREDLAGSTESMNKTISHAIFPTRDLGKNKFARGDRVMFTANNREHGFINGELGTLMDWQPSARVATIRNDHGTYYKLDSMALAACVEWAYALTVHKAQGSETDTVIILLRPGAVKMYTRNLLLTALSRAKRRLILVGHPKVIELGLQRNPQRQTGLYELLVTPRLRDRVLATGVLAGSSLADVGGYE